MIMNLNDNVIENRLDIAKKITDALSEKQAVCLYGGAGIGKTALATAILETLGYEVIRLNGSMSIPSTSIPTCQSSMSGVRVALLVDEMDRSKVENYETLLKTVFMKMYEINKKSGKKKISGRGTRIPLIFCCNFIKKFKLKDEYCKKFEIKPLDKNTIFRLLQSENRHKQLGVDRKRVLKISEECQGDIRAAVNNLKFGEIYKKDKFDFYKFVQKFFILDNEGKHEMLTDLGVGEYGSPVFLPYFVKLVARNIKGDMESQVCDHALIAAASTGIHEVPVEMTRMVLSCMSKSKVFKIKFPPKKKKDDE